MPSASSAASQDARTLANKKMRMRRLKVQKIESPQKSLAVDQYMARRLLSEIPLSDQPSSPDEMPSMTRFAGGVYHCDACHLFCSSREHLTAHLKGRRHTVHVLLGAMNVMSDKLQEDKFGIKIRVVRNGSPEDVAEVELKVDVTKNGRFTVEFLLMNEGQQTVTLARCILLKSYGFKLEAKSGTILEPDSKVSVKLGYLGRHVGYLSTTVVFMFTENETKTVAHVIRKVRIHVKDPLVEELRPKVPYEKPPRVSVDKAVTKIIDGLPLDAQVVEDSLEKKVKLEEYAIPRNLRCAVNHGLDAGNAKLLADEIAGIRRVLDGPLNAVTHCKRFSLLLHIEEIQMEVDIRKYDLHNVTLAKCEENRRLLTMEVPGLLENRPSVLRGDHLFVRPLQEDGKPESCEYKGYVHEVREKCVSLGFSEKLRNKWLPNMKFNCRFVFNRLPQRLQHRAVHLAQEHSLESFLFPTSSTVCKPARDIPLTRTPRFFNKQVESNAEQALAVKNIVYGTSRPAPFLVFGPPGTGKTVTLVEAINQVIDCIPSAHILVCAPSNSAADLIAVRVLPHMPNKSKLYRLCAASRDWNGVPRDLQQYCNYDKGRYVFPKKSVLEDKTVIVCTLVTAGRLVSANFPSKHFTHVFIDEAGQATEAESLIALAGIFEPEIVVENGGQVVLAGDPEQLGPVLRSPVAVRGGLGMSLLERYMKHVDVYTRKSDDDALEHYDRRLLVKLIRNYRSHPEILRIPNELFYDSELEPHADKVLRESLCSWEELPAKGFPMIFHGVVGKDEREERSPSFFNVDEISVIKFYVDSLLRSSAKIKVPEKEIGIISPYRKQVQKIRRILERSKRSDISVGSVEEFQGQERRVIIISTVRSNTEHVPLDYFNKLGFLSNPKRFNVAVTRAKALLIVVGNPHLLIKDKQWSRLLRLCKDSGAYTGCDFDLTSLDNDEDIEQLAQKLSDVGIDAKSLHIDPGLISDVTQQTDPEWRSNI